MKTLNTVLESVLSSDMEDKLTKDMDAAYLKKFVEEHIDELFDKNVKSSSDYKWGSKGITITSSFGHFNFRNIVKYWKEGIKVPIANPGWVDTVSSFDDRMDYSLPKDADDLDILLNEVMAKAGSGSFRYDNKEVPNDPRIQKLLESKAFANLYIVVHKPDLPSINWSKVAAKYVHFERYTSGYQDEPSSYPMIRFDTFKGWKGNKIGGDHTLGIVDLDDWYDDVDRVVNFNEDNRKALDMIFGNNTFKELVIYAGMNTRGNSRKTSGKPYYVHITKSSSDYEYKLK